MGIHINSVISSSTKKGWSRDYNVTIHLGKRAKGPELRQPIDLELRYFRRVFESVSESADG
jgi:hypothetical protein